MRPLSYPVIACIVGAIIIIALAIMLTSPVLVPAAAPASSGGIQYGLYPPLPPPRYYTGIDYTTLKSNDHLTVIPLESIRQQVTNYSCGAVSSMTVLSYYNEPVNNTDAEEVLIAHQMYPDVSEKTGINPEQITSWFRQRGWNATWGTNGTQQMLIRNLNNGIPTMVEWIDWGGHWVVVTGYDTRGTENPWDDVIIFADSVDCHDDRVDGTTYFNYWEFDAEWFDAHYFPPGMNNRVYVVAVPGNTPLPPE
jgi:hypothetical protein